jgi:hypothetical protein
MFSHLSTNPGWLPVMPGGYPYAWHSHGGDYPSSQPVLRRFEPKPELIPARQRVSA